MLKKSHINRRVRLCQCLMAGTIAIVWPSLSQAQVLSPMDSYVAAQGDQFLVSVKISNPYPTSQTSEITVLDHRLERLGPVTMTSPETFLLAAGEARSVSLLIPFEPGRITRIIYVCHAIHPRSPDTARAQSSYKGEVCGKVSAFKPY